VRTSRRVTGWRRLRFVGLTPMRLRGKTALVMPHPLPGMVQAQFDDLTEPESHGWHAFEARRFRAIDRRLRPAMAPPG
jgi:hypothetical protein